MDVALSLAALVVVVIAVSGLASRLEMSAPLVLVAVGIGASYLPFVPEVHLSGTVVLVGLIPPLLYSAALQSSLVDFNNNRRAILLLSVGLVAFTAIGVGLVVHALLPGVSWPAAFALGAVVAPPDAVAATAIARRIGMPRRVVTILEGESLLNDATALVALRTATATAAMTMWHVGLDFLWAAVGGVVVGFLVFLVVAWVRRHLVEDPVFDTSVSFVTPFLAYLVAEQVNASGVLAVVISGLLLGHKASILQSASSRISETINWRTISFLLENAVFLLIGLQARWIIRDVANGDVSWGRVTLVCLAVLLAVIVLRLGWVFPARYLIVRPGLDAMGNRPGGWQYTFLLGWSGMRGVVTLAAAFAIPTDFPHRDVLILAALVVTAGTLFIQGSTLPWLVRHLGVRGPDAREDALARAALFQKATAAGLEKLAEYAEEDDPHNTVEALRRRAEERDFAAWERLGATSPDEETPSETYARLRLEMLGAERARVLQVRDSGRYPHEVIDDVLRVLDVEESMLDVRSSRRRAFLESTNGSVAAPRSVPACEHLAEAEDLPPNTEGVCEECVALGEHNWVHLRQCLTCGKVGCCDSSPRRHATEHFVAVRHPVMRSAEPGEEWRWCFIDNRLG